MAGGKTNVSAQDEVNLAEVSPAKISDEDDGNSDPSILLCNGLVGFSGSKG